MRSLKHTHFISLKQIAGKSRQVFWHHFFSFDYEKARKCADHPDCSDSVSQFNIDHELATIPRDRLEELGKLEEIDIPEMHNCTNTQELEQDPHSWEVKFSYFFNEDPQVLEFCSASSGVEQATDFGEVLDWAIEVVVVFDLRQWFYFSFTQIRA